MAGAIPRNLKLNTFVRLLGVAVLTICAGLFMQTSVRAEKPTKVMGAVKSTPVSNVVVPVQVAVPNDMKKEAAAVAGAVKTGGVVAATPISIPRPIQLEKITELQLPARVAQSLPPAGVGAAQSQNDVVQSAEIISVKGNEATLRVAYMYDRARPAPVYAGAFIYDAQGNTVNAGYKPAIAGRPQGFIDINLVLPETPFYSNHIVVFFMESGR
ncbi:MAG: hypothetical protein K8I00_03555, partial [Candidatus Omnitrophica bacterium]|nr:hypothetical protein [Candidatus Omnitrophota bacterium]